MHMPAKKSHLSLIHQETLHPLLDGREVRVLHTSEGCHASLLRVSTNNACGRFKWDFSNFVQFLHQAKSVVYAYYLPESLSHMLRHSLPSLPSLPPMHPFPLSPSLHLSSSLP